MTVEFKDVDSALLNAAKFLRNESASGVKVFEGVMADKRVDVFKGASAVKALLADSFKKCKKAPKVESQRDAEQLLKKMLDFGFFIRASSINGTKFLQPDMSRSWSDDALYAWVLPSSQFWALLGAFGLLVGILSLAMFPLWPSSMKGLSWYVFMACLCFLGLLVITSIVRLILFGITYIAKPPGIWLFPNLFEDVSFIDSFIPLWDWHKTESPEKLKKLD